VGQRSTAGTVALSARRCNTSPQCDAPSAVVGSYRCPVCGEEMLVNEAIIDVAIGAAKFRGEYTGGMPTLGCPGCNGETMEYVDQES